MTTHHKRLATLAAGLIAIATFAPGTATAAPENDAVRGADEPHAISGRYIVELRDSARPAELSASLADTYNADITHTYDAAFTGFAAALDVNDARALAADPSVRAVHSDAVITIADDATPAIGIDEVQTNPPANLDRMDETDSSLDGLYTYPDSAGSGRSVYLIDTGVTGSHPDFSGIGGTRVDNGWDFIDNDATAQDCNGHGTGLAGIVAGTEYGVAKLARVIAVRALDCNGAGTISGVISAIDWVVNDANGATATALFGIGGGPSSALDNAVTAAANAGISIVVPAGAEAADACNNSPGRVPAAFTIGGLDTISDTAAPWSNHGPCVDLWAPATNITLPWYSGGTNIVSGSSFGAAHAAGALALYLAEHPTHTSAQAEAALLANSADAGQPGGPILPRVCIAFLNV